MDVRAQLEAEEEVYDWDDDEIGFENSPSAFILAGIDLEEKM